MRNRTRVSQRVSSKGDSQDSLRGFKIRLVLVTLFFALLGMAVLARAVHLQIFLHADLTERATSQYQKSVYLTPTRGVIYDRRGRELAANVECFSVYAQPALVEDNKTTARRLSKILGISSKRISNILSSQKGFTWLKRQVTPKEAKAVRNMDLPGIGLFAESKRFYPHRELASQAIGFAGVDSQGLEGIEYAYDRYLKGNAGWLVVQRDALDRAVFGNGHHNDPENRGNDVVLTIDQNIQYFAQEEIRNAVRKTGAKQGIIMVMAPQSGEVLAMAISNYFNPNNPKNIDKGRWRNVCLSDAFEPGSTMKPIIIGAALEEGTVSPRKWFDCQDGEITIHGKTIRDVHEFGYLSVKGIIAKSSNVGAIKIGQTLSPDSFYRWLSRFGFGQETGIDLSGESKGLLRPVSEWSGLSQPSMTIGQELGVTPIQLISAYAAIASDGYRYRPRIVSGVYRDGKAIKLFPPETLRRVLSSGTTSLLKDMLKEAVTEGTGVEAAIPGYTVAGKTGTAQKYDPTTGGYSEGKYLSSFIGFVPVAKPAVVILVMLDEPMGTYYGGSVAAPVFSRVGQRILTYLAIPQDNLKDLVPVADFSKGKVNAG